jgi:tyrosinase
VVRGASGDPEFALPYWDYYKNPNLPEIFADPMLGDGEANPLYWADRKRNIVEGLTFKAFEDDVTVFPWGPGTTYEDLVERNPHGRVHDQIGGSMGRVPTAPADPIFFLHHCNIDRLWSAWVAAGGKRSMPPRDSRWWKETFAYNLDRSWSVSVEQMEDTLNLGYAYSDLSLPMPPRGASLPLRPPVVAIGAANAAGPMALDSNSITVEIPLDSRVAASRFIDVVLDGVTLSELGQRGGFSYNVYANLPATRTPIAHEASFEIGELGSFEISMPRMNGMAMPPGSARTLRFAAAAPGPSLLLSFVAYGSPAGASRGAELLRIGRIRVVPR